MVKNKPLNALSPFPEPAHHLKSGTIIEIALTGEKLTVLMPCEHLPKDPPPEITGQKYLARTATNSKTPITECEFKVIAEPKNMKDAEIIKSGTIVRLNLTEELLVVLAPCPHEINDPDSQYTGQKYLVRAGNKKKRTVMACEISTLPQVTVPSATASNTLTPARTSL